MPPPTRRHGQDGFPNTPTKSSDGSWYRNRMDSVNKAVLFPKFGKEARIPASIVDVCKRLECEDKSAEDRREGAEKDEGETEGNK